MSKPARFVLTADDLALTPGVTRGIITLLEARRITATGAMTNRPDWSEAARQVQPFAQTADIGLHFNLTVGEPLTPMPKLAPGGEFPKLPALLRGGLIGLLPLDEIALEFQAQLSAFEDSMGRVPDFVDGHQHIHALPGVRRVLAEGLVTRYPGIKPYIRDPADRLSAITARRRHGAKASLLATLARPFAARMRALGFAVNSGFSGYSAFDPNADYAADFATYLIRPGVRHLVMCHPGEVDDALRRLDPATESRPREVAFFLSKQFDEICDSAGLKPGRFAEHEN